MLTGVPDISCNGCSSQVLNALDSKVCRNQFSSFPTFSTVGGKGISAGLFGVGFLAGQLQLSLSSKVQAHDLATLQE